MFNDNPIVTEIFIRERKLNISLTFIMQSYFKIPPNVRLNSAHCFIMKILNKRKRELQQFANNIGFDDFKKIYKKLTAKSYSFLVNYMTLHYRQNF